MLLLYLHSEMEFYLWILFTFHYASTLSLMTFMSADYNIRFTFHYASTLSHLFPSSKGLELIYIPLCFYFIWVGSAIAAGAKLFTFHYASTLSIVVFFLTDAIYRFTFHYASTLSHTVEWHWDDTTNLHSTMLLLYQHD